MKSTFGRLLVAIMILMSVSSAAQTPRNETTAVGELRHAGELMESALAFFNQATRNGRIQNLPSREDTAANYQNMRESIEIFQKYGSQEEVTKAFQQVQGVFLYSKPPKSVPQAMTEVVQRCERESNFELTSLVAFTMVPYINGSKDILEAKAKFGPLIDNPKFYDSISPPSTGFQLLRNLKWALDHDAILRDDFYTPDNMTRFLGTSDSVTRYLDRIVAWWVITPSETELTTIEPRLRQAMRCTYRVERVQSPDGHMHATLNFNCNYNHIGLPTFEEVETVFGKEWRDESYWVHAPPPAATAPHGNVSMTYHFSGRASGKRLLRRTIVASFASDATLDAFTLSEEDL